MIKFRCQRCSQKIATNDEGAGVVIACPTCAESLIIPPQTYAEFISPCVELVPLEPVREELPKTTVRDVVRPYVERLLANKFFQALLMQRRQLLQTQDEAADQLAMLEQRVVLLQMKFQRRLTYYQERVTTLEAENGELSRQVRLLAQDNSRRSPGRVSLRESGFLLRT